VNWVFSVTSENWEIVKGKNIWAVSRKSICDKVKKHDTLIFYVKKTGSFKGIFRVASDWYETKEIIWTDELQEGRVIAPYQIKIEPFLLGDANFIRLEDQLTFVEKKRKPQIYLMGTPANFGKPLSESDYQIILSEMKKAGPPAPPPALSHEELKILLCDLGETFGFSSTKEVPLHEINPKVPESQRYRTIDVVWRFYGVCIPIEVQAHGSVDSLLQRLRLAEATSSNMIVVGSEKDIEDVTSYAEYESKSFRDKIAYIQQKELEKIKDHIRPLKDLRKNLKITRLFTR